MQLNTSEILEKAQKHLMKNVGRFDMAFAKGHGLKLWDADGKEYLDFLGGIAVCALGHSPEILQEVMATQGAELIHVSNYFYNQPMVDLAELLCFKSGLGKAFFCNSGVEANEAALKLARKYSFEKYGPGRDHIITAWQSFHGRSFAAISASGQDKMKHGYGALLPGFSHVPFGDLEALAKAVTPETCAIFLEPIQGEGGVVTPPEGYLAAVEKICQKFDLLLVLDEVQTGLGRTGRAFAFQHYGIKPHIISLAKALGGGLPCGAMLAQDEVAQAFTPGSHSTTQGGSPFIMAAALAVCQIILADDFLAKVRKVGTYFQDKLRALADDLGPELVKDVRGQGLMLGLELSGPALPVVKDLMTKGFIINATADTVLRFVPPLIVTEKEIDALFPPLRAAIINC